MSDTPLTADPHMLRRQLIAAGHEAFAKGQKHYAENPGERIQLVKERFTSFYGDLLETLSVPLNSRIVSTGEGNGYRYENILFESHPGWEVSATLYLPASGVGPFPPIVVAVGHSGKQFPSYQFPCQYFARSGFAALVFDPPGVAGEKQPGNDHFADGVRCYLTGDTSSRYFVGDALSAMDYLSSRPDIDTSHGFACTGVSGGGHTTVFAALLDSRITAASPSCCLSPQQSLVIDRSYSSCPETLMFGRFRDGIDDSDLLCALAPLPVLFMAGQLDEVTRIEDSRIIAERAQKHYAMINAPESFRFYEDAGGHAYSLDQSCVFIAWLRECWQLPASTEPSSDPKDYELLPAESLQCHPHTKVNMRSITTERANKLAADHTPPTVEFLKSFLKIKDPSTPPEQPGPTASQRTWFHDWNEATMTSESGIVVPYSSIEYPEAESTLWHFDPQGRLRLADRGGLLMEAIGHLDRPGPKASLLAADLRGWGDSAPHPVPFERVSWGGPDRFASYISAALGDPVEAARVRDAYALHRARPATKRSILHATGAAGPTALHLAALTQSFSAVILHDAPASYADLLTTEEFNWPHDLILPHVLQSYDLPLLAKNAGCPVHWINPRDGANQPLSRVTCDQRTEEKLHYHCGMTSSDHLNLIRELLYPKNIPHP